MDPTLKLDTKWNCENSVICAGMERDNEEEEDPETGFSWLGGSAYNLGLGAEVGTAIWV